MSDEDDFEEEAPPEDQRPFHYLTDLLKNPSLLEPPPIVVPRLAWQGRVTLLAAREKVGKSTLMGQAVASLALAPKSFLGDDMLTPKVSLWLGLDEPLGDIVRRFDRYALKADNPKVTDRIAIRNSKPDAEELLEMILRINAELVVIDHLTEYGAGHVKDPNSPTEYQPILKTLRMVAQQSHCAIVLLHHSSKAGGYRDSTQIGAGVDAIVEISPDEKDESIRVCKCRGRVAVSDFRMAYNGGYYETTEGGVSLTLQIQRVIRAQPGCSTRQVVSQVSGRTESVLKALGEIEASGLIKNDGGEHKSSWFTLAAGNGKH